MPRRWADPRQGDFFGVALKDVKAYENRRAAGKHLATHVVALVGWKLHRPIVLALPRGGVPVAAEVATALGAPLDVIVVRKIGFIGHRETAMGAIATVAGNVETVANASSMSMLDHLGRRRDEFREVAEKEHLELLRRDKLYRGDRPAVDVSGRAVVVVDDGVATGASMRAAVAALRLSGPDRVVIAVPVCLSGAMRALEEIAEDVVCPWNPPEFMAVGQAYQRFDQTSDEEVRAILEGGSEGNR